MIYLTEIETNKSKESKIAVGMVNNFGQSNNPKTNINYSNVLLGLKKSLTPPKCPKSCQPRPCNCIVI